MIYGGGDTPPEQPAQTEAYTRAMREMRLHEQKELDRVRKAKREYSKTVIMAGIRSAGEWLIIFSVVIAVAVLCLRGL